MSKSIIKTWQTVRLLCRSTAEQAKYKWLTGEISSTTWFCWSGWSEDAIFSELLARKLTKLTVQLCSIALVWTNAILLSMALVWTSDSKFESLWSVLLNSSF